MFNVKQLSIQKKLSLAMVVSLGILCAVSIGYIVNTYYVYKSTMVSSIVRSAGLFTTLKTSYDKKLTDKTLSAIEEELKLNTKVYFIRVYDAQNRIVALRGSDLSHSIVEPKKLQQLFQQIQNKDVTYQTHGSYLNIYVHVRPLGKPPFFVLINAELADIYQNISDDLELIVLVLLIAIFILSQVTNRISETILTPIKDLQKGMLAVSKSNDFSKKLKVNNDDELGALTKGFNNLLEEIQANQAKEKQHQKQIQQLAYIDTLTGIANRRMFLEYLDKAIEHATQNKTLVGIIYFDVDDFKRVNDSLGHHAGDELLRQLSKRIENCLRLSDGFFKREMISSDNTIFARLGGDEFTLVLQDLKSKGDLLTIIERLRETTQTSFPIESYEIMTTLSIGATLFPEDAKNSQELLANADIAMYKAKKIGKDTYQFYEPSMGAAALERLSLTSELKNAIAKDQLTLVYQPKLDMKSKSVKGAEALLRWHHPTLGEISPADFIPIAEEAGLIHEIGQWVLDRATQECLHLQHMGFKQFSISVNVSPKQFQRGDIVDIVREALNEIGLPAKSLELELTEGVLIDNHQENLEILKELKDLGVKLSIDDFGTGYSSLSYLSQFPIDKVKIDHSFVSTMLDNTNAALITDMVITLAHALNIEVIAEGVEKIAHLKYLSERQCDTVQGFLISRGLPLDELITFLQQETFEIDPQVEA